jgi:hypothetical protein
MMDLVTPAVSSFSVVPSLLLGGIIGVVAGVLAYRYTLIKNPNLLNTLITKATTDINTTVTEIAKKKQELPTAAPVAVKVAPAIAPTVTHVLTPVAAVPAAPVAAPVVAAITAPAPVAAATPVVAAAPAAAPAAPAA